jgi:2-hydroxy-6-oxonona-2,4-dienedioate hydrolase
VRVKFTDVNGIPTRYYHEGSGYPVLLLHGAGVSADTWLRNIDVLARDFAVYAPDTLGHGFTGSGDYKGGPPQPPAVEHLVRFADYLNLKKFAAVGSSYGALLASLLYLRLPERVEKLILVSSGSVVNRDDELSGALQQAYTNGLSAIENPTLETCRRRMQNIFYDPSSVPEEVIVMQLTLYALPGARESFERRLRGMMDIEASRPYRVVDRLEQIKAPTLLVWGREDPRGIYQRAVDATKRMPRAHLVAFDRCKHHPHIEHPDRFNALARQFLRGEMEEPHPSA